jgi:hypothetical protein
VHRVHVKEAYDRWLEDEGVLLAEKNLKRRGYQRIAMLRYYSG